MQLPAPMLLRSARLPTGGDYAFEPKWDGFRCLVSRNGRLRAVSRRGWDMTALLPELEALPDGLAVDGEATPYDLRHTFASLLIHEGRSVPAVAAMMGHSRPSTTLDTYSHVYAAARLQKAVEMVDAIAAARSAVLKTYSAGKVRRLRQSAPGA